MVSYPIIAPDCGAFRAVAAFSAKAYAEVRSFGAPEAVREHAAPFTSQMDDVFRETGLAEGWADSAKVDAMVAELRAWGERPASFGCAIWCGAVGWVDGDGPSAGG